MTEGEARRRHDQFIAELRATHSWLLLPQWHGKTPEVSQQGGAWLFWYSDPAKQGNVDEPHEVVLVRKDNGKAFTLFGAIAKVYLGVGGLQELGLPTSSERWMGSGHGRYQTFDKGYILWDQVRNVGYLRVAGPAYQPATVFGLVAFFDIRGFTSWSARQAGPSSIQDLLTRLESILNAAFCEQWCAALFVKGTGDGFMLVSEAEDFAGGNPTASAHGHALAFLRACRRLLVLARPELPKELALGCGIDCGNLQRLFLFGQRDYLGPQVNYAAKHQQSAWDEVVVSTAFLAELRNDGAEGSALADNAKSLGGEKFRITAS